MTHARLPSVALGVALCDADHRVREQGGNNRGPRIRRYLENVDPPIAVAAPWCAAAVQYWADVAARGLGVSNPLDRIRHEALVQDYVDFFRFSTVTPEEARPGDIVAFSFGGARYDHMGLVAQPVRDGHFWSVEGNTSDESQRDGDAVVLKPRDLRFQATFVQWAA